MAREAGVSQASGGARVFGGRGGVWALDRVATLRLLALVGLAGVSALGYLWLLRAAPASATQAGALLGPLLTLTAGYVGAVWLTLRAPATSRRAALVELGALLALGALFRALLFGAAPALSHDAYRYAWDPYLLAHGVNPYTHTPDDPALTPLRDGAIWPNLNWRDAPTIYPPGAQAFFLLIYALAPLNIWAVKAAMTLADAGVALLGVVLLRRRGQDVRRILIYWWSPIPVIECALNGHLDIVAALWTLAALLLAERRGRGARGLAGVCIALAALTKLYPALFLLALVRPAALRPRTLLREWPLALGFGGALALGYAPVLLSQSHSTGFLSAYFGQRFVDQGVALRLLNGAADLLHAPGSSRIIAQLALLLAFSALVLWARLRAALRPEEAMLALTALWLAFSPHLFPWYVVTALPLLALCLRPPSRAPAADAPARRALAAGVWLFTLAMPFTYVIFAPGGLAELFPLFFAIPAALAPAPWLWRVARPTHHSPTREGSVSQTT